MTTLTLLSRRPGVADWHIRSRLSELNYKLRNNKVLLSEAIKQAAQIADRWTDSEPLTDFMVEMSDESPTQPVASREFSPVDPGRIAAIRKAAKFREQRGRLAEGHNDEPARTDHLRPHPSDGRSFAIERSGADEGA